MANPVKVQTATTPNSLKVMSNAEMDYISHVILTDFAATDTGVGTLSIDPVSTVGLTSIGVWDDTSWDVAPGGQLDSYVTGAVAYAVTTNYGANNYVSSSDQLTTVSNTFWQNLGVDSETITAPLEYDTGLNRIIQQTDTNLNASIVTNTLDRLAAFGLGSYKLQVTSPVSGGTWTAKASVTDTSNDPTNTYSLWRRTTQTAPTTIRPLKHRLNGNIYDIIEMTDTDIETLTARFRNQIATTTIGTYSLQEAAPGVGTWTRAGEEVDDTRSNAYTGTYVPDYAIQYTSANYTTDFTSANYTTDYAAQYTSANYTTGYTAFYGGFAGVTYTSANYTTDFAGVPYTSPNYTTNFTSPNYTTDFAGVGYASLTQSYSGTYISATVGIAKSTSLWIRTA
jgi:hypothetical protein